MIWNIIEEAVVLLCRFCSCELERDHPLNIDPPHACANSRDNFPSDRPRFFAQFSARNFFTSIASHEDNIVAYLHIIEPAHIDHHQVHCYSAQNRAALAAHQNGGATIGKMPGVTIGVTG